MADNDPVAAAKARWWERARTEMLRWKELMYTPAQMLNASRELPMPPEAQPEPYPITTTVYPDETRRAWREGVISRRRRSACFLFNHAAELVAPGVLEARALGGFTTLPATNACSAACAKPSAPKSKNPK